MPVVRKFPRRDFLPTERRRRASGWSSSCPRSRGCGQVSPGDGRNAESVRLSQWRRYDLLAAEQLDPKRTRLHFSHNSIAYSPFFLNTKIDTTRTNAFISAGRLSQLLSCLFLPSIVYLCP